MLKSIARIRELAARRFASSYAAEAAAEVSGVAVEDKTAWPYAVPLGRLAKRELVDNIEEIVQYVRELEDFAQEHGLELAFDTRVAGGKQRVPTHALVPSIDAAASVAGPAAKSQLKRARERARVLHHEFARCDAQTLSQALRASDSLDEADLALVVRAASWFMQNDSTGLTPRQVPLEGFHAKWLDSAGHRKLVMLLSGRETLGLVSRPAAVEFAYLDPAYLALGKRRLDSYVLGDAFELPYEPRVALVVENKDTYLWFPQIEGGVCVFGSGKAGVANVGQLPWIGACKHIFYWGDMDADGIEILDAYRASGLDVTSLLMDKEAYARFECYGTSQATGKRSLEQHRTQKLEHLTKDEHELYAMLTDSAHRGPRRIEQERIPLEVARVELLAHL